MAYTPHLIAPFENSGLKKWYKPWITGEKAFPLISDAYARRGVVRKREGYRLLATFPSSDKPVQGLKNWINPSTLGDSLIGFSLTKAYLFIDGSQTFSNITFLAYPTGVAVPVANAAFTFGNSANDYYWTSNYAASMWVATTLNNAVTVNIKYYNGTAAGGWNNFQPVVNGTPTTLNGSLLILPYKGRLVALNTFEGTTNFSNRARWSQIGTPYAGAAPPVATVSVTPGAATAFTTTSDTFTTGQIVSFFGLAGTAASALNGINGTVTRVGAGSYTVNITSAGTITSQGFVQQQGNPPAPFQNDINAWREDIPGKGGFIDADTSERIVSAEIIRDTMIVTFQRSTWRLRYTGNEILPFIWERLNTQYGCESTHSHIAFDDAALFFSRYGWIASSTNDVDRIDLDIPDDSFAIDGLNVNITGLNKVQGIRDFYRNFAYWTYLPIAQTGATQIYGYNYIDKSWTIFNPSVPINVFGTYRNTAGDFTWSVFTNVGPAPPADTWENFNSPDDTWQNFGTGQNEDFPYILGGDLNGNVYLMFEFFQAPTSDNGTAFNFNITTKRFNPYMENGMKARVGYVDIYCTTFPGGEITLEHFVDDQETPVLTKTVEIFSRGVINITALTVGATTLITTQNNHGLTVGESVVLSDIVGNVGQILNNDTFLVGTTPTLATFTINDLSNNPVNTTGYIYNSAGYVYNADLSNNDATYTRVFLGPIARMHQISLSLSAQQLADPVKGVAQFELQGLVVWTKEAGRIRR